MAKEGGREGGGRRRRVQPALPKVFDLKRVEAVTEQDVWAGTHKARPGNGQASGIHLPGDSIALCHDGFELVGREAIP